MFVYLSATSLAKLRPSGSSTNYTKPTNLFANVFFSSSNNQDMKKLKLPLVGTETKFEKMPQNSEFFFIFIFLIFCIEWWAPPYTPSANGNRPCRIPHEQQVTGAGPCVEIQA